MVFFCTVSMHVPISFLLRAHLLLACNAGGYCKEYVKGQRPVGVMLDDTWFLRYVRLRLPSARYALNNPRGRMTLSSETPTTGKSSADPLVLKWEKRKRPSTAYAPSLRSGCTMALWSAKTMGVLFGGVTDEDTSEETMDSVFHNDLYDYVSRFSQIRRKLIFLQERIPDLGKREVGVDAPQAAEEESQYAEEEDTRTAYPP